MKLSSQNTQRSVHISTYLVFKVSHEVPLLGKKTNTSGKANAVVEKAT